MNFGEAIQAMKDGKRVCRKGWETVWLAINNLEYGRPSFMGIHGHLPNLK